MGALGPDTSMPAASHELVSLTGQLRKTHPAEIWDNEYIIASPALASFRSRTGPRAVLLAVLVFLILAMRAPISAGC